jgi:hypothetical protein
MNTKKLVIIISAISLLVIGVVVVSAQRGWDGPRGFMQMRGAGGAEMHALIEEYTGLDAQALRAARADGSTLAELIEANGQSVEDFTAAALEQAEARITEHLNSTSPMGGMMGRGFHGEGWRGQGPMAPEATAEADA